MRARLIGGLPADLVGSLTGLTQGHFPVHAKARYADDIDDTAVAKKRIKKGNAALPVTSSSTRRGINIFAKAGSPVIAVQDGKIVKMGRTDRLGKFIQLRDVYGNTYTYAHLKKLVDRLPGAQGEDGLQGAGQARSCTSRRRRRTPSRPPPPAPARRSRPRPPPPRRPPTPPAPRPPRSTAPLPSPQGAPVRQPRPPGRLRRGRRGAAAQRRAASSPATRPSSPTSPASTASSATTSCSRSSSPAARSSPAPSSGASARTEQKMAPHMLFEVRPAGRGAPRIDPKPILDGWKLLESTAIYRAAGKNPFWGPDSKNPSIGQILLMSKEALQHRVLTDPAIDVYDCGRRDIKAGDIDRRVLATLEFLAASGLKPTVTALHCGHSYLTTSGNVSEHSSGNAVDIAAINGIPILGHQGPGSITDITIRRLLTLQGTMKPHQIISLMTFDGADNTLSLPDHNDHIHVGFQPLLRHRRQARPSAQLRAQAEPVDQADRPAGQDRQPDGPDQAVEVRAQGAEAGQQGPRRRVALFGFVQLEFPWALGPARRPLRGARPRGRDRARAHRLHPGRARAPAGCAAAGASPPPPTPAPVATGRVTLVTAQPFYDEEAADELAARRGRGRGAGGGGDAQPHPAHAPRRHRRPARARAAPRAGARRARRSTATATRLPRAAGSRRSSYPPWRRARAATRRCARRSASARCSAAATPCSPARSSPCARARTSTPGAGARPRCSSTPR